MFFSAREDHFMDREKRSGNPVFFESRRSFTLLEMVVTFVIIAILTAIGGAKYAQVMERSRATEAKSILGSICSVQKQYQFQHDSFTSNFSALRLFDVPTGACAGTHYFRYDIPSAAATTFVARAVRCQAGGKNPDYATGYEVNISQDAIFSGDPAFV